jgi:glycine/D-amino acid oxidase-like deaminating enzyme/nitrite reductase/ring-hydroxylating ferredoxin subunit
MQSSSDRFITDNGASRSLWMETPALRQGVPLQSDLRVDVCIVGAGISGLTTAYHLARRGRQVAVLDDGPVGGGESCRTTAHITAALDDRYFELERLHGEAGARLAAESHGAAVAEIARMVAEERIDCDFLRVDGYLFDPAGDSDILIRELDATRRAAVPGVELVERVPLESFDTGRALRFPQQAQFHILRYLRGLSQAIARMGVTIHSGTHVTHVEAGRPAHVRTAPGPTVTAEAVVVATNTPVIDRVVMHTKQAAYRSYVVAARVPENSIPRLLLWDTLDPYHYVRLQPGGVGYDYLIVGGEDHRTGEADNADERHERLSTWTRERFPQAEEFPFRWSGQVMEPVDGLGYIGRNPGDDNLFIVTGDSGNGMTHGTIAGMLLPDLIEGHSNSWAGLYDPTRKTLGAIGTFGRENAKVAGHYADLITGGDASGADDIAPGTGAVLREGMSKVAVFRDPQGMLHRRSAICPHLGCVVRWNSGEKTWDCPCHGSRFHALGEVVNGPANTGLRATDVDDRRAKTQAV